MQHVCSLNMKISFTGLPGSGKSYKLGQVAIDLLVQNEKIWKKSKGERKRVLWSNMKFRDEVLKKFQPWQVEYWSDRQQLIKLRDADVIIDEEQVYFDAQEWQMMSSEEKRFFQQHRRYGVDIYAASQDFAQVDKSIRRVTSELYHFTKIAGSRDISSTRPNPRFVWGAVLVKEMDPQIYDEQISKMPGVSAIRSVMFITKKGTQIFNTREEIHGSKYPPLKKIVRVCPEDGYTLTKYV